MACKNTHSQSSFRWLLYFSINSRCFHYLFFSPALQSGLSSSVCTLLGLLLVFSTSDVHVLIPSLLMSFLLLDLKGKSPRFQLGFWLKLFLPILNVSCPFLIVVFDFVTEIFLFLNSKSYFFFSKFTLCVSKSMEKGWRMVFIYLAKKELEYQGIFLTILELTK